MEKTLLLYLRLFLVRFFLEGLADSSSSRFSREHWNLRSTRQLCSLASVRSQPPAPCRALPFLGTVLQACCASWQRHAYALSHRRGSLIFPDYSSPSIFFFFYHNARKTKQSRAERSNFFFKRFLYKRRGNLGGSSARSSLKKTQTWERAAHTTRRRSNPSRTLRRTRSDCQIRGTVTVRFLLLRERDPQSSCRVCVSSRSFQSRPLWNRQRKKGKERALSVG